MVEAEKSEEDLRDHSRVFRPATHSSDPKVNSFIDGIIDSYFSDLTNIQIDNLRPLLLDLYLAYQYDPDTLLSVSRDKSKYSKKGKYRYRKVSVTFIKVMDILHERGFIYRATHRYYEDTDTYRTGRIWATDKLVDLFKGVKLNIYSIDQSYKEQTVILKKRVKILEEDGDQGKKKPRYRWKKTDYRDNRRTVKWRKGLDEYNNLLKETHIDIGDLDKPYIERKSKARSHSKLQRVPVNQHNKFCYRVFNGNFKTGGRVYGGWWQQVGKQYRQKILINGKPTVEVDFSGWHIALLYLKKGIEFDWSRDNDPYDVHLPKINQHTYKRWLLKTMMLVSINAGDEDSAIQAIQKTPTPEDIIRPEGLVLTNKLLSEILDKLKEKHSPIAEYFCTGMGIKLQNVDGEITMNLIAEYTKLKIPLLAIHDSYVIEDKYHHDLWESMQNEYERVAIENGIEKGVDQLGFPDNLRTNAIQYGYYDEEFDYEEEDGGAEHRAIVKDKEILFRKCHEYMQRFSSFYNRLDQ